MASEPLTNSAPPAIVVEPEKVFAAVNSRMPGLNLFNTPEPLITPEMITRFPLPPEPRFSVLAPKLHGPLKVTPAGLPMRFKPADASTTDKALVMVMGRLPSAASEANVGLVLQIGRAH